MITCALTKEQISDLANDVYAHINADPATFDIDVYMNDLFNLVATSTGSVSRAAMFVQTAFAIIGKGRSIPVFKSVLDATPIRKTALVDMINKFTSPVEGLEKVFLYIGFKIPGTTLSTTSTSATPITPTPAEEEEEEEKTTKLVPNEEISIGDITYEDFELLPDTDATYQELRELKTKLDTAFANAKRANPTLYTDISKFLSTSTAVSIISQYNTALATVPSTGTPAKTKPANIKLGTTGEEISTDMSLLYLRSLLKSLKSKLATLTTRTREYTALANDINALDAFIKQYALYTNKDIFLIEQEIEKVLDSIRQRMASVEKNPDGTPVKSSEAYIIKEEEYARVSLIVEKILEKYFRQEPFGAKLIYINNLVRVLNNDRSTDVRAHLQRELVSISGGRVSVKRANKILDAVIEKVPDFLEVLGSSTITSKIQTNYLNILTEEISAKYYDASREVGNEVDEAVRDFVADIGATSVPETSLLSEAAAKQLQEILEPFKQTVGEIASNTDVIYSDNTKVAGQMDLLFIDENSEWWIVDVKTGQTKKWSKYSTTADADRTYIKNALQQIIYKKILQEITGLDKINLGILPLEVEYDGDAKISSIKTPAKVGTQKLTADAPFITINVNEKHVVFTSDVPSDTTKKEMTLEQIVDEALGNRLKEVTEEETGAEEEEPSGEETGEGEGADALEDEKQKITPAEFKELTRLAKFFLENPKEPAVSGSVVTRYPALFKEVTAIEKRRQEELEALPFDEQAKQRLEFAKTKGEERYLRQLKLEASKIPSTTSTVSGKTVMIPSGSDIMEKHDAEDVLANPNSDIASRIMAVQKLADIFKPYNEARKSDILKDIAKIEAGDIFSDAEVKKIYDAELAVLESEDTGGETTTFTNDNTVSLTSEQETELTKIDDSKSSDRVNAKAKLVRELLNSGQELYGEYFESGNSRSLILKVNGKTLRVGVFLDTNILLNQGDIIKLSLQKESVVPGEAFDVIYEDVVNLVDAKTNGVVGRMRVSDATIFSRASEQRQKILGMLGAVTDLSQLLGVVKEAFNFRLQFPTSTINQELSNAIEVKRAELALLPDLESISKNTYFFRKGDMQSVDTAYKVVSYNEAREEIVISLVNNPSVEEKMSVKDFQKSFDLLLGVEGEPVVLSQEEKINLELTNENLDAIKSDPSTTFGEANPFLNEDDSSLEDDIGNNSKC